MIKEYVNDENITIMFIDEKSNASACIEISHLDFFRDILDIKIKDSWFFNRLYVDPKIRHKGIATQLMNRLINILDEKEICLINTVNAYGDLDRNQLINFYKKFGFKQGNSDEKYDGLLVYIPNQKRD